MNVLHVTPYFAPAWAYGGVARAVTGLARAQVGLGHRVIILTTDALSPHERLPAGDTMLDGVRVVRVRNVSGATRTWLNLSTPVGLRARAKAIFGAESVDVAHFHELRTVENLRVMGVCPSSVLKVVSPHGTIRHDTGRSWAKQAWDATCGDRILRQADLMVALSEVEAREIRGLFDARNTVLRPNQVHVVPNGVDLSAFAALPQRIDARRRFGLSDEGPVVLFFGRLTERKGIRLLIAAFDRAARNLPGAQLLVAGPDHGAHAAATALVSARGLDASVRFAGFLSGDDVLAAFAAADVFALPAIGEGIPLAALEALASGVPVLLSPDCNLQAAEDGGAGRIVPLDEKAWADALRELLVDPGTVASMRTAARGVAARFTWPSIAADMLHVYARARGAPRA